MSRQDQSVSDNSTAIQAGGSVIINQGMTPAQMAEVMVTVVTTVKQFTDEARKEVDGRLDDFRNRVLEEFADTTKANSEAFRSPDFQFMLGEAQTAYARSGDSAVRDTLSDIIARRSLVKDASREALTLNDAAARAPRLTTDEFSALSLNYICRNTHYNGLRRPQDLAGMLARVIMPLFEMASEERSVFWHIEAQSLGRLDYLRGADLRDLWSDAYAGLLGKGFSLEQTEGYVNADRLALMKEAFIPCYRDRSKFQPFGLRLEDFRGVCLQKGIVEHEITNIWNLYKGTIPQGSDFWAMLEADVAGISAFARYWDNSPIKALELNSVGIAIAHANAKRVVGFDAPLGIWIK